MVSCYRAKTDEGYSLDLEADLAFVMDDCDIEILSALSDCSLICECKLSYDTLSTFVSFVWR